MSIRKRSKSPFLFLFFPNIDHYKIHDQHQDISYGNKGKIKTLQQGLGRTMCVIQGLLSVTLRKNANIIIPRYRRKKNENTLKINGIRNESDKHIYYGCLTQLSLYIHYPIAANLRAICWFYGSILVQDKTSNKFRRTEFKQMSYTHYQYEHLWHTV
jgi:hypothetical protein